MSTFDNKTKTKDALDVAVALLACAHFIYDHCSADDWLQQRDSFGYLLNAISAEVTRADRGVGAMFNQGPYTPSEKAH